MLPSTCMRRNGTACETAHCMVPPVGVTEEALGSAPEGAGGVVVRQAGVGVDVAGDVNCVGRGAEAEHLGVKTDGDIYVVFAGQEEQRIARGAEFAVLLDGVDLVDLLLDFSGGHGGIEEQNVGAEVWARRLGLCCGNCGRANEERCCDDVD